MKSKINLLFLGRGVYLKIYIKYKGESFTKFLVDLDVDRNTTKVFKKTYKINLNYKEKI